MRLEKSLKVCMVAYTFYETDSRVKQYAEALAERGDHVDVIALSRDGHPETDIINNIRVYKIQGRVVNESRKITYLIRLTRFFAKSMWFLTKKHMKERYDLIHVHSVPDFEVFAALIPKLMGAKVILDIHDIVPEFYASKFNVNKASVIFKALVLIERISASFADHVIIANHLWQQVLTLRSIRDGKCTTILNYPDVKFYQEKLTRKREDGKFVMLYPGTLNWHQGLDLAVKAFARVAEQLHDVEFHIIGEGPSKAMLLKMIVELGMERKILVENFVPHDEIVAIMADADLGIVPKRANSFGNEAFSTKIFEFMALGVPVIVSDTKIDRYYFNDSLVKFFKAEDEEDLARCIVCMVRDRETRERQTQKAMEYIRDNSWAIQKQRYFNLVDDLAVQNG